MIEETLIINYGVLGLWTASLLLERYRSQKELRSIIVQNTEAILKFRETIKKCNKNDH